MPEADPGPSVGVKLPEEHYAAIGKVAEAWAGLELSIDMACWTLANLTGRVGACLTAQVSGHARKMDAYIALSRLRGADDTLIRRLNKFAVQAQGMAERRNRVVHDPWMAMGVLASPHRLEVTARKKVVLKGVLMLTADVLKLAEEIDDLWMVLETIKQETDNLPRTSFGDILPPPQSPVPLE